jgi:Uma2 family endonuclease
MSSKTLLTAEQYLETSFGERPPEFVHGELIARSMPKWLHSRLQHLLAVRLHGSGLLCAPELHMRLAPDVIRIADIAVYRDAPSDQIPTSPPFVVIEVISPDDKYPELLYKLKQYQEWGIEHIWVVEPEMREFQIYGDNGLMRTDRFELAEFDFRVSAAEVFAEATGR